MRHLCILLFVFLFQQTSSAQGTWTWIHGDSVTHPVKYNVQRGTKGVSSPLNIPLRALSIGFSWKDATDKFWAYGSFGNNFSGNDTAEIWSFDWKSNQWTWEAGFDTMYIDGYIPDSIKTLLRKKIARFDLPFWSDDIGNLWYINYNNNNFIECFEILKFNIQSKHLEIVDYRVKSNTTEYGGKGTKGIPSASNWPKYIEKPAIWVVGNRVFIFGGRNSGLSNNELWEYNMSSGLWAWHGGSTPASNSSYGIKGIASSSNWPDNIYAPTSKWVKGNKLYMYGGLDDRFNINYLTELWEYDVSTGFWTWLNGETSASLNHPGVYSSKTCIDTYGLFPAARSGGGSLITNVCNNSLWMYSGGIDNYSFSDLWLYKPSVNRWVWVYGGKKDTNYSYGLKGVTSYTNKPPSRGVYMMWSDNLDRLYMFGAVEYCIIEDPTGPYNYSTGTDMWRYDPDYSCINYSLSDKFIDRRITYRLCLGDSTRIDVRKGYDSLRITPMTGVRLRSTDTTTELWVKPTMTTSYKIIAYGYRCQSLLDSLTVPISVYPPKATSETKTICYGSSYHGQSTTGVYTFNYLSQTGCDSVHTLSLTVRTQNLKILDTTVCEGQQVLGRATTGTYRDTFIGSTGCDSIRELRLTIIPKYLVIDTAICLGRSYAGYTSAGTYYDTLTSPQGCITYRTIKLAIKLPTNSSHTIAICQGQSQWGHTTSGTYRDTLVSTNGCDSVRILNLTVKPISSSTQQVSICAGTNYLGRSIAGIYYDTFQNSVGCDSIRRLELSIRQPLIMRKLRDTILCRGQDVILDAGLGHKRYTWSTGEMTPHILVSTVGEYKLIYTDSTDCIGRDSAKLSYASSSTIDMVDSLSNYQGELLSLTPLVLPSDSKAKYRWSPAAIFDCDSCKSVQFRSDSSLIVTLSYTDAQGCTVSKRVKVNIYQSWAVGFPTAFSPNGDLINDEYYPNVSNIMSYKLSIYNRWGLKVYATDSIGARWDGMYRGVPAPIGVYSYVAEVVLLNKVIKIYTGSMELVR